MNKRFWCISNHTPVLIRDEVYTELNKYYLRVTGFACVLRCCFFTLLACLTSGQTISFRIKSAMKNPFVPLSCPDLKHLSPV
jgi:hypothetical protein